MRGNLMDKEMSAVLMADFTAEQVGHKPVVWCKQCTEANRQSRGSTCANHKIVKCLKCRTKVTDGHNCLDFVGHADARARLCQADPEWTWEPFEFPGVGALIIDNGSPVGLWIKLTIGGVTKPGYGSVERGKAEAMKELIGDALRNAALSFGVAWKLWAKGDRTEGAESAEAASSAQQSAGAAFETATPAPPRNGNANSSASRPARGKRPAAKAPDGAETDIDWMGHLVDDLIPAASTRGELLGFWDNVQEHVTLGKCADDHAAEILAMVKARAAELGFEKDKAAA